MLFSKRNPFPSHFCGFSFKKTDIEVFTKGGNYTFCMWKDLPQTLFPVFVQWKGVRMKLSIQDTIFHLNYIFKSHPTKVLIIQESETGLELVLREKNE